MTSKTLFGKLALTGFTLIATIGISRAQVTITDIGLANPTPGPNDVSQLLDHTTTGSPANLNYYFDAGNPPGSLFTTPSANAGGYVLNSVAIKTQDDSSTSASYYTSQTYVLRVYSVSGTTATLLGTYTSQAFTFTEFDWLQFTGVGLPVSPGGTYAYTIHRSTTGWENLGWTNGLVATTQRAVEIPSAGGTITFATDTTVAGTFDVGLGLPTQFLVGPPTASAASPIVTGATVILRSGTVVDNVGNGTYTYQWQTDGGSGGTLTNIPGATFANYTNNTTGSVLGNIQYQLVVTDSTSQQLTTSPLIVNVIQREAGTFGTTAATIPPTPGSADAFQLHDEGNGNGTGNHPQGNLNYYSDNGNNNGGWMGNTFTTGSNPKGYYLTSLAVCLDGQGGADGNPNYGYASAIATTTNMTYSVYIYKLSADLTTCQRIAQITNWNGGLVISNYPNWFQTSFAPITLASNSVYGYGFGRGSVGGVYMQIALSPGDQDYYTGGTAASFPTAGGAVTTINNGLDGVFDVGLIPLGAPFLLSATIATPNPVYALSPVKLACSPTAPGNFTYQWFTDDGSGSIPPNLISLSGATATNATVIPQNINPGGPDYTTNYYFVATDGNSGLSVTSSVLTVTVHPALAPVLTDPTPTNLVTFVGASPAFTAGEIGTLPFTNQWQFDNGLGGGYVGLTARTNTTLTLANVQTTNTGNYVLMATNLIGYTNTDPVTLTVLPDPAAPNPVSQLYYNMLYTNHPWAYWRLNETTDPNINDNPSAPTVRAYDYSGHGFLATYGNQMTVSNAGPSAVTPGFPGFDSSEFAAGTEDSVDQGYLSLPNLNLTGNRNITFMAWINPSDTPPANSALLFNRGGPDNACGFGFAGANGANGDLGYTWNNNSATTYNYDSGLTVVPFQWNFVAYVITATNTTMYLGNLNGGTTNFLSAVQVINNTAETWNGGTARLGNDQNNSISRSFPGLITEAALFTNALSTAQIQQYFTTGIGALGLAPSITSTTQNPPGGSVYSGQNVILSANYGGTAPLVTQWQSSPDFSTWTDVSGATNGTSVVNPQVTVGLFFRLKVANSFGTNYNSPVYVLFNPLPATPPGLWTVNFQPTNNLDGSQNVGGGVGHYVGRGIFGNGMYWNILPHVLPTGGGYNANTITSVSDLQDDGATHAGIYCQMNSGGSYNALGGSLASSYDIGNLLDQFYRTYYSPGALQFFGVPDGTYNVCLYAGDGLTRNGANDYGSTFIVYDSLNGNQTNSTAEPSPAGNSLQEGVNFVIFTGVHVSGGNLTVDVYPNLAASASASAIIQGAQLQLVSLDPPPTNVTVSTQYVPASRTMTLNWSEGFLQSATNVLGPWTPIYAPQPVTITTTNAAQFFRIHP